MQQDIRISDEQLVERIMEGRTSDFALLVHRHAPSLLHFVGRMLSVQEEAEEVVQDVVRSFFDRIKRIPEASQYKAAMRRDESAQAKALADTAGDQEVS